MADVSGLSSDWWHGSNIICLEACEMLPTHQRKVGMWENKAWNFMQHQQLVVLLQQQVSDASWHHFFSKLNHSGRRCGCSCRTSCLKRLPTQSSSKKVTGTKELSWCASRSRLDSNISSFHEDGAMTEIDVLVKIKAGRRSYKKLLPAFMLKYAL